MPKAEQEIRNLDMPNTDIRQDIGPPGGQYRGRHWKPWIIVLLVLLVALGAIAYAVMTREREKEAAKSAAATQAKSLPKVQTGTVERAKSAGELEIPGTTTPLIEAYIYSRSSGYLQKRFVDIGSRVTTGQLLAVVSAPDLDQQVEQADAALQQTRATLTQMEAQLNLAGLTWNRWKVLVAKGVFSRQDGDTQEANYRVALANVNASRAAVRSSEANLQRLRVLRSFEQITAPFSGIITARNVDVGALISGQGSGLGFSTVSEGGTQAAGLSNSVGASGTVDSAARPLTGGAQGGQLFTEAETDRLRILVSVPEGYADDVKPGQRAKLRFQGGPNQVYSGKVTRVSDAIDASTRTMLTEIQVANRDGRLKTGMYVTAIFEGKAANPPLIVPGDAIVVRNDTNEVAVIRGGIVHLTPVTLGRDYGAVTEITSGLREGDTVALDVTDDVKEGAKVQTLSAQDGSGKSSGPGGRSTGESKYGPESRTSQPQNGNNGAKPTSGKSLTSGAAR